MNELKAMMVKYPQSSAEDAFNRGILRSIKATEHAPTALITGAEHAAIHFEEKDKVS